MPSHDTIFALSTPPIRSGVAIMRISGPQAFQALEILGVSPLPDPRTASLRPLLNPVTRELIDNALVLRFVGPASFTGEDIVELHLHGSIAVMRELSTVLSSVPGLRPAEPGEFSRRAFLNGRMDLTGIEGLGDLIDAETVEQKRQAQRVLGGEMACFYEALRARLVRSLAHLEAYIDFPDEEIPENVLRQVTDEIAELGRMITKTLDGESRTRRIRDGFHIVILGAPNAGKSSLMNWLSKRDVSIVSHHAGTTRDVIETHLDINGFSVVLMDTAGLRQSQDEIESEGISRALDRAESADLKIILFDGTHELDSSALALVDSDTLIAITKSDIISRETPKLIQGKTPIVISTKTGAGIDELLENVSREIIRRSGKGDEPVLITRERHKLHMEKAKLHLISASLENPLEIRCEELRLAASHIGKITGRIEVDELLDEIFRSFCIGK